MTMNAHEICNVLLVFVLICAAGNGVVDATIVVTVTPSTSELHPGGSGMLHCSYNIQLDPATDSIDVRWRKSPVWGAAYIWVVINTPRYKQTMNRPHSQDINDTYSVSSPEIPTILSGHTLTISKAPWSSEGEYVCEVTRKGSSNQVLDSGSGTASVTVPVPVLVFSILPFDDLTNREFKEDKTVTAKCAYGRTAPAAMAFAMFTSSGSRHMVCTKSNPTGSSSICSANIELNRFDHNSSWHCQTSWLEATTESNSLVSAVKFTVRRVSLSAVPIMVPGSTVTVTCQTDSAYPTSTIRWKLGQIVIQEDEQYSIHNAEADGDFHARSVRSELTLTTSDANLGKVLLCEAVGGMKAEVALRRLDVTIEGYDKPVQVGSAFSLTCVPNAEVASMKWSFANETSTTELIIDGMTYRKKAAEKSDAGVYTCEALPGGSVGESVTKRNISVEVNDKFEDALVDDGSAAADDPATALVIGASVGGVMLALIILVVVAAVGWIWKNKQTERACKPDVCKAETREEGKTYRHARRKVI